MKLTAKCVAHVWCLFEGEALIAIVRGDDQDVDYEQKAKRITACVNACAGIPTETLEAGVVVVPVELLRSIRYLLGKVAEQDALTSYDRRRATELVEELGNVLSRLQQNGGDGR